MVSVWLIRHGESESNVGLPTSDSATSKLTPKGHEQAKWVARSLPLPDLIVTSPYLRAKQTAQPALDRFPDCPQAEWAVQEFTYLAPKLGQTTIRHDRRPRVDAYWERCDPFYVDGQGVESFADLVHRVEHLHEQIQQLDEEFVVIFSHAVFIRAFLWLHIAHAIELTPDTMHRFRSFIKSVQVPNGAIVKAHFQHGDVFCSGVLTDHLAEVVTQHRSRSPR